ncbi:hypothetical protein [Neobacillus drentensis]
MRIETTRDIWTDIVFGEITMEEAITNGEVKSNEDEKEVVSFFNVFEL